MPTTNTNHRAPKPPNMGMASGVLPTPANLPPALASTVFSFSFVLDNAPEVPITEIADREAPSTAEMSLSLPPA